MFLRDEERITKLVMIGSIVGCGDRGDYRAIENRMVVKDDAVPVGHRILQGYKARMRLSS